jgi:hypothetical protein
VLVQAALVHGLTAPGLTSDLGLTVGGTRTIGGVRVVAVGFLCAGVPCIFVTALVLCLHEAWGVRLALAASLLALARGATAVSRVLVAG